MAFGGYMMPNTNQPNQPLDNTITFEEDQQKTILEIDEFPNKKKMATSATKLSKLRVHKAGSKKPPMPGNTIGSPSHHSGTGGTQFHMHVNIKQPQGSTPGLTTMNNKAYDTMLGQNNYNN